MNVSRSTLLFAVLAFAGYQAGFVAAYRLFPSAMTLVIFPAWMAAIGFALMALPVGWLHSALLLGFIRRTSRPALQAWSFVLSLLVVLPVITALVWLNAANLSSSFRGGVIAPDDDAFRLPNAMWNAVTRYGITLLVAAWGSTFLLLRDRSRDIEQAAERVSGQ